MQKSKSKDINLQNAMTGLMASKQGVLNDVIVAAVGVVPRRRARKGITVADLKGIILQDVAEKWHGNIREILLKNGTPLQEAEKQLRENPTTIDIRLINHLTYLCQKGILKPSFSYRRRYRRGQRFAEYATAANDAARARYSRQLRLATPEEMYAPGVYSVSPERSPIWIHRKTRDDHLNPVLDTIGRDLGGVLERLSARWDSEYLIRHWSELVRLNKRVDARLKASNNPPVPFYRTEAIMASCEAYGDERGDNSYFDALAWLRTIDEERVEGKKQKSLVYLPRILKPEFIGKQARAFYSYVWLKAACLPLTNRTNRQLLKKVQYFIPRPLVVLDMEKLGNLATYTWPHSDAMFFLERESDLPLSYRAERFGGVSVEFCVVDTSKLTTLTDFTVLFDCLHEESQVRAQNAERFMFEMHRMGGVLLYPAPLE